MPNLVVTILYGEAYLSIVPLLGLFSLSLAIFSLIQVFATYNLAVERYKFLIILFIGFAIEALGIYFFHNNLGEIVKTVFISNVFILISLLIYNRKEVFKK
jgi:O-antigen/teichoic acid export membrane protein